MCVGVLRHCGTFGCDYPTAAGCQRCPCPDRGGRRSRRHQHPGRADNVGGRRVVASCRCRRCGYCRSSPVVGAYLPFHNESRCCMTAATPQCTLTLGVVICAYTFDRWDDVLAAVASVRGQTTRQRRSSSSSTTIPTSTPPPRRSARCDGRREPEAAGVVRGQGHRRRGDLQRCGGLPGRRCGGPPRLARTLSRRLHRREHRRCRRHHPPAVGIRSASVVPRRVRLGLGLYVHREGTRAGPEPSGWQRLLPARGFLGGGRIPESHRPDLGAAASIGLRGDGVLHPGEPASPGLDDSSSNRRR